MATQIEGLTEEQSDDVVVIDNDTGEVVDDTANDNEGEQQQDDEADVVSWGSSQVEAVEESEGMKNLRARLKELDRENRQLKGQTKADDVGPEPDMEEYWDKPEQYKVDLLAWSERRRTAEEREASAEISARKQQERWEAQSRDMESGYAELRVVGKDAARATVEDAFPGEQFAYLVKAAGKNAPAFILALGNAADKRAELASLAADGSWAEFIATAAIMSKEVNVQRRRPATSPEENRSSGGASGAGIGAGSRTLERLETQARKTGNWSEVFEYKRKLKNG